MNFFIMKSYHIGHIGIGDLRTEIKILLFLRMGQVRATACAVYASNLLPCAHYTQAIVYHKRSLCQQLATACALYANNLLPHAQLMLANFNAQTTLAICYHMHSERQQFFTVCAVYASKLLPHAQYMLAFGSRMRSVRQQFATICAVVSRRFNCAGLCLAQLTGE